MHPPFAWRFSFALLLTAAIFPTGGTAAYGASAREIDIKADEALNRFK